MILPLVPPAGQLKHSDWEATLDLRADWHCARPEIEAKLIAFSAGRNPSVGEGDPLNALLLAAARNFGGTAVCFLEPQVEPDGPVAMALNRAVNFASFASKKEQLLHLPQGSIHVNLPKLSQQDNYSCGAVIFEAVCRYYSVGGSGKGEDGGKTDDWFKSKLGTEPVHGTNPEAMVALAKKVSLPYREFKPMSDEELRKQIESGVPVIMNIQAWGKKKFYKKDKYGHYVAGIGFTDDYLILEDPAIEQHYKQPYRGYMAWEQLDLRWHDTDAHGHHFRRWGLALYRPEQTAEPVL